MTILQQAGQVARSVDVARGATTYLNFGIALALSQGDPKEARQLVRDRWWHSLPLDHVKLFDITKAAVPVATTTDSSWVGALAEMRPLSNAFVEYLRPQTVLGRLDGYRPVPFNTKFPRATAGSSARWAGEGKAIAATKMAFDTLQFP